jgi:multiple antibiotic resistance protein
METLPEIERFLQVMVALLAITDPLGAVPVFLSLTAPMSPEARRRAPMRAAVAMLAILSLALLAGQALLKTFGISLPAFGAAGGLLLVLMGLEMLGGSPSKVQDERSEERLEDHIWVPLAMPLLAGPGSIATVITFTVRASTWLQKAEIAAAILLVSVVVYLTLRSAGWLHKRISSRGQRIFIRFMGLILVAVGAQLLLSGIWAFQRCAMDPACTSPSLVTGS